MIDITAQISKLYNTSPFDIMERDAEYVIMVINYVLEKYSDKDKGVTSNAISKNKQKDNFWDF